MNRKSTANTANKPATNAHLNAIALVARARDQQLTERKAAHKLELERIKANAKLHQAQRLIAAVHAAQKALHKANEKHLRLKAQAAAADESDTQVSWDAFSTYEPSISISESGVFTGIWLNNLDNFKDDTRLLATLATLDKHLTPLGFTAKTRDWAYSGSPNRDYSWELELPSSHPTNLTLRVCVYAYVRSDSPTCRVIVRGTREVVTTEEIKEIVCE